MNVKDIRIAVIGLGYVGLPLAVEFGKRYLTTGFDINRPRIAALISGHDSTLEVDTDELESAAHLSYTTDVDKLKNCNIYIVTVPTPIDIHKRPDLSPLEKASETVGKVLSKDDIVIYEGELESLRRFKDDAQEVRNGMECGIGVKNYNDVKPGDLIEVFDVTQVQRSL